MKKQEMNIAIAESMGAEWETVPHREFYNDRLELHPLRILSFFKHDFESPRCAPLPFPDPLTRDATCIPNYTSDLNAMHEVCESREMSWEQRLLYADNIEYILSDYNHGKSVNRTYCIEASARIRAEAYLRTIGKWEGSTS